MRVAFRRRFSLGKRVLDDWWRRRTPTWTRDAMYRPVHTLSWTNRVIAVVFLRSRITWAGGWQTFVSLIGRLVGVAGGESEFCCKTAPKCSSAEGVGRAGHWIKHACATIIAYHSNCVGMCSAAISIIWRFGQSACIRFISSYVG